MKSKPKDLKWYKSTFSLQWFFLISPWFTKCKSKAMIIYPYSGPTQGLQSIKVGRICYFSLLMLFWILVLCQENRRSMWVSIITFSFWGYSVNYIIKEYLYDIFLTMTSLITEKCSFTSFFLIAFIESLRISHHVFWSHISPHLLTSVHCPCNSHTNQNKIKIKTKK